MIFSADKLLEMTNGKGGVDFARTVSALLKRRILFMPRSRLFMEDIAPRDCDFCNGKMEWTGEYSSDGFPKAHCHFCGMTITAKDS